MTETCRPQLLTDYLQGTCQSEDEAWLFSHLEQCLHCRSQLDAEAADQKTWDSLPFLNLELQPEYCGESSAEFLKHVAAQATGRSSVHPVSPQDSGGEEGNSGADNLPADNLPVDGVAVPRVGIGAPSEDDLAAEPIDQLAAVQHLLAPTDHPYSLGRFHQFEVSGIVGSGGMGVVLKALEPALNRFVAIKILAPHLAASAGARQRFAREAQAAAAVTHDAVIAIHQIGEWLNVPFLVMPYLPGPSLQKRIDTSGQLDLAAALRIAAQVAEGLHAAHQQGLIHRDVKPANVLLSPGTERAVLTDFGLARAADDASVTRSGMLAGTPAYMSPEQARGQRLDARSDLFSLGSVLFEMLTGSPAWRNRSAYVVVRQIADQPPPTLMKYRSDLPLWVSDLLGKLHAYEREQRFESAEVASRVLHACLAHINNPQQCELPAEIAELKVTEKHSAPPQKTGRMRLKFFAPILLVSLLIIVPFVCASLGPAWWRGMPAGGGDISSPQRLPNEKTADKADVAASIRQQSPARKTNGANVANGDVGKVDESSSTAPVVDQSPRYDWDDGLRDEVQRMRADLLAEPELK